MRPSGPGTPTVPYWAQEDTAVRFATSWCMSPRWLGLLRLVWAIYAFTVLFVTIGIEVANHVAIAAGLQFAYFTSLGYWALAFYFAFSSYHSFTYSHSIQSTSDRPLPALAAWHRSLRWAHAALHTTIITYPIVVTLVFWTVLRRNAFFNTFAVWSNVSQHALNSTMALSEILLCRALPAGWGMLIPLIGCLGLYLAETYIFHAARGYYVYPFLDPANGVGLVVGAIFGVLLGTVLVFVIVRYVVFLRIRITEPEMVARASDRRQQFTAAHPPIELEETPFEREQQLFKNMGH